MFSTRKKVDLVSCVILGINTSGGKHGTAFKNENIVDVHHYRTGIMVLTSIMNNGCTDFVVLERGVLLEMYS